MKKISILSSLLLLTLIDCSTLKELLVFTKCEFKIKSIDRVSFAGINLLQKHSINDFKLNELAVIATESLKSTILVSFIIALEAKNPNAQAAAINNIEWIAFVDNLEFVRGNLNKKVEISPSNGTAIIPLQFQIDLKKISNKSTANSIANLALSIMNIGDTNSKLRLDIKPTVYISNFAIEYPGYISLTKEFSSGN